MNSSNTPRVAAVIVHWNHERLTRDTLLSLLGTGYGKLKIILVDNGSNNGSAERIAKDFPEIRLIRSEENLGYAGGANIGFAACRKLDAKYYFLLNNDVLFDSRIIDALVGSMEGAGNKTIGICVPKIYFFDDPARIWYAGGIIDPLTGICRHIGYGQIDGQEYSKELDCTFANGCAMFIRSEVIESVGFFDESFFHTGEDVDYSLRLSAKGYRIVFVPCARLWHRIRSSTGEGNKATFNYLYYEHRNRFLILKKYFREKLTLNSYFILANFYFRSIINEVINRNIPGVGGILKGLVDGYRSVIGRRY